MAALTRLTNANVTSLLTTQLGSLKPYQLEQVLDFLSRTPYDRKSVANITAQSTISTIVTAMNSQNA